VVYTLIALGNVHSELRAENIANNDFVAGMFILMFCAVAFVIGSSKHMLAYRLKDFFSSKRTYTNIETDVNRSEASYTILLSATSSLSLAILICNRLPLSDACEKFFGITSQHITLSIAFVGIALYLLLKTIAYTIVNSVFFRHDDNKNWISSFYLLYSLSAFLIYPISLIDTYSKIDNSIVTFCLSAFLILYKICLFYRLCVNFKVKVEGLLLIILYFCNVEIMPLLIIGHFCFNI